jgi:hypothetical protein
MNPRGNANGTQCSCINRSAKSRALTNCRRFRVEAGDSWWGQAVCLSTNPAIEKPSIDIEQRGYQAVGPLPSIERDLPLKAHSLVGTAVRRF